VRALSLAEAAAYLDGHDPLHAGVVRLATAMGLV